MTTQDPAERRRKHIIWFASTAAAIVALSCMVTDWTGSGSPDKAEAGATSDPASPSPTPHGELGEARASGKVSEVVDGSTLRVDGDGKTWKVGVLGVEAPKAASQCWGDEAVEFATETLADEHVTLYTDPGQDVAENSDSLSAYVVLDDGTNYSVAAAEAGAVRVSDADEPIALADEIQAAAAEAKAEDLGLWGEPCDGELKTPEPSPSPEPSPEPSTEDDEAGGGDGGDDGGGDVYYENCAEVRAAGAAPLHRGEPGYRPGLDRDGDGIACDT